MIYEFVDTASGERRDVIFGFSDAPRIGETITHEGATLRRVPSCTVSAGVDAVTHGYPYVSNSMPRNIDGCDTTPQGKPIIKSRRHEREVCARHGCERD